MKNKISQNEIRLFALIALREGEISEGRCVEITGIGRDKLREEMHKRTGAMSSKGLFPCHLTEPTERALSACGRERVHHNDGSPPSIRIDLPNDMRGFDGRSFVMASGDSHEDAAIKAVNLFTGKIREQIRSLEEWESRIKSALASSPIPKGAKP